jgi:hypothetical protein
MWELNIPEADFDIRKLVCEEWIMRSLWERDISTAVPNNWQAEFGKAPGTEEGKMQHSCFPKLFMFREVGMQVSLVTMSHPSMITVAPPPCLPLIRGNMGLWGPKV